MNRLNAILLSGIITFLIAMPCALIATEPDDTHESMESEVVVTETLEVTETETEVETETETVIERENPDEFTATSVLVNTLSSAETEPVVEAVTEPITEEETIPVETKEVKKEEPKKEEPKHVEVKIDSSLKVNKNDELSMIACIVYQEMGGDYGCDDCRRRIADTVLNRVASPLFPNTIYEVLTQGKMQYGFDSTTGVYWQERCKNPGEAHAVERAYRIAEEVLNGQHSEIYGKDYIWQAEFIQGINNIYCCNTYFGQLDKNKEW